MKTYKLTEDWPAFQKFIIDNFDPDTQHEIGILFKGSEIFIRTVNERILKTIKEKYKLIPCKQPDFFFDDDRGWQFFGNSKLFDII